MILSFNQPAFLPWGGFFARLLSSDRMVLLDDTVLARGFTFVNRNRLKGPQGEIWLSVPLKRKGRGAQKIKDLEIYEKERWKKKFLATLQHYYGHSVQFKPVIEEIRSALDQPGARFLDLSLALLDLLISHLGIDRKMVLQSGLGITGKGTPLLVSIASRFEADEVILPHGSEKAIELASFERAGIKVRFLRYAPPQYPQFWGNFLPNLSTLDLLLCCGPEGRAVIETGIHLCQSSP
jgi:hypothetical protein